MRKMVETSAVNELIKARPYAGDFFSSIGLEAEKIDKPLCVFLDELPDIAVDDFGMSREHIIENFVLFLEEMEGIKDRRPAKVEEITIIGGMDKDGNREEIILTLCPGEIFCIVGPTGSGKSRLLADIECLAQEDTPTGRKILLNGRQPSHEQRFSAEHKLIAQLSQNMNFIMDLTVSDFIRLHAESRLSENIDETVASVISCANGLAGEKFRAETAVTALSGGQSRALMIADTALLSRSPVVLIDEIENAGVDREKALGLLVEEEKIVLMSTHDPILALMGGTRIVIKNGGISRVITPDYAERTNLDFLRRLDYKMTELRRMLRSGIVLDFDLEEFFRINKHQERKFDTALEGVFK